MFITVNKLGKNVTYRVRQVLPQNILKMDEMNLKLYPLYLRALEFLKEDISVHYSTYYRDKPGGKKRRIDVPKEPLSGTSCTISHSVDEDGEDYLPF